MIPRMMHSPGASLRGRFQARAYALLLSAGFFLAALSISGCAGNKPDSPDVGPTGHISDSTRFEKLPVSQRWQFEVMTETQILVKKQLQFSKTAEFNSVAKYEAYYDKLLDVTQLIVYGNVETRNEERKLLVHSYHVVWERHGNALHANQREDEFQNQPWALNDTQIYDSPI